MGIFQNAFFFSGAIYALFYENKLIIFYLLFLLCYVVLYISTPSGKFNSLRKKVMLATWKRAEEGNIHVKIELDCTKILQYFEKFDKTDRPTITHVVAKALSLCLAQSKDSLNGKIIFDKFVPFDKVTVTLLVDINQGQDLAGLTIENKLQEYIKSKAQKIKTNKDEDHKKRISSIKYIPPFILRLVFKFGNWVSYNWGMNIKQLSVKKDGFGAGCVTSLGMLGIKDAVVPFPPWLNFPVLVAVGEIVKRPIVRNDEIVIAPVVYINATVDHRFIDGAKGKNLFKTFYDIFENPEKY